MSARRVGLSGANNQVTVQGRQSSLSLSPESVVIHKGGIEFRSPTAFAPWTEMTLALQTPEAGRVRCSGVVVSCTGNKHLGYHVSVVFTAMSKQAESRLAMMAFSPLA